MHNRFTISEVASCTLKHGSIAVFSDTKQRARPLRHHESLLSIKTPDRVVCVPETAYHLHLGSALTAMHSSCTAPD